MKLVLTGGPCAGKTTISEILVKTFSDRLTLVPEAASILFAGGFPRRNNGTSERCQQRAIYHVQRELEEMAALENPGGSFICDRGGLDALAYWPGTADDFFRQLRSSMADEVARYDWVLHLDTAGTREYRRTPIRVEDFDLANRVNEKVKEAWKAHPRRLILPHNDDFTKKIIMALQLISAILQGQSQAQVEGLIT